MDSPSENGRIANRQIARAAGTVMLAFVFSQVVGLVRYILIGDTFGTQAETDAFWAANRLTDLVFNLVAGGALASAFVPTFTGFLARGEKSDAWRLASAVANLVLAVLVGLAAISAIFAPFIVQTILAPKFPPAQQALTVDLLRIMLPAAVVFGLSGLVMGILNAHQRFLLPALAPSMYSLGIIFGLVALSPRMGIFGPAWGVLIGASLHLLLQMPALLHLAGRRYFPSLGWHLPAVREVIRLMAPRLLGVAAVQLNFLVNTNLTSGMPHGSLTGITYGFAIMYMPLAAIAQSIATASLPTFSAQVARGRVEEMRASLAVTLRGILLLSLPAAVGLILLRVPLVATLYQHGSFTAQSTQLVAWALLWYSLGLVGFSVVEVVSRAFYALHDTRTPVLLLVVSVGLNIVFSLLFIQAFTRLGWAPHGGLALANSLATALEMVGLLVLMRRRLGGLGARELLGGIGQAAAGSLLMGVGVLAWLGLTTSQADWLVAMGGVVLGGVLYGLALLALRVPELYGLLGFLRRRLQRL
jgi:putative peptidoglycan lipid II flippase